MNALTFGDFDSDGDLDVIYGDDQWGEVHGIDAQTGIQIGYIDNPEHGVVGLSIGDYDNDGVNEVSWYLTIFKYELVN